MERWLFIFFVGAVAALFLPVTPSSYYVTFLLVLAMLFALIKRYRTVSGFFFGCAYILLVEVQYQQPWQQAEKLILANAPTNNSSHTNKAAVKHKQLHQTSHLVVGTVESIAQVKEQLSIATSDKPDSVANSDGKTHTFTQRFNFLIQQIDEVELLSPIRVRLSWQQRQVLREGGNVEQTNKLSLSKLSLYKRSFLAQGTVKQGQRWQLSVKIKPAFGLANQGSFSYQTWLRQELIHGTGYVKSNSRKNTISKTSNSETDNPDTNNSYAKNTNAKNTNTQAKEERINYGDNRLLVNSVSLRANWHQKYQSFFSEDYQLEGLMTALAFGERSQISDAQWKVLTATGTQHLMAISGLHVGLVAVGSYLFSLFLCRSFLSLLCLTGVEGKAKNLLPRNYLLIPLVCSLGASLLYAYLAGFSLPTVRALIMLSIFILARLLAIRLSLTSLLLTTVFVVIIIAPFSLISISFWLSFYAVCCIFFAFWRYGYVLAEHTIETGKVSLWSRAYRNLTRFVKSLLLFQIALSIGMLPIVAIATGKISLVVIIANLIAVPWMSFVVIPLNLVATLLAVSNISIFNSIAVQLLALAHQSFELLWIVLNELSSFDWSLISLSSMQTRILVLVFIGSLFLPSLCSFLRPLFIEHSAFNIRSFLNVVSTKRFRVNYFRTNYFRTNSLAASRFITHRFSLMVLAILVAAIVIAFSTSVLLPKVLAYGQVDDKNVQEITSSEQAWKFTVFDVGHGLAILIERNNRAILYDTGAKYPSGFNMIDSVITPYLTANGIKQLDKVIISHLDNDHVGGLVNLLAKVPVKQIVMNSQTMANYQQMFNNKLTNSKLVTSKFVNKVPVVSCAPESSFNWQGLTFNVLSPESSNLIKNTQGKSKRHSKNDSSCVIRISDLPFESRGSSVLFTGDISKKVEARLLTLPITADVLVVPHHGSNTSSSASFLAAVSPSLAIVSAAKNHHWNLPNTQVVNRYKAQKIELVNTAELGMIQVSFNDYKGNSAKSGDVKWRIQSQRNDLYPFWFAN